MQEIHGLTWKLDASELAFMSSRINIQCGEISVTFTGAHPWNGLFILGTHIFILCLQLLIRRKGCFRLPDFRPFASFLRI